ncbi:hypothetical protein CR513_25556, partial [Mucuna pruriens]
MESSLNPRRRPALLFLSTISTALQSQSSNIPTDIRGGEGIVLTEAALTSVATSLVSSAANPAMQSPTPASHFQGNAMYVHSGSTQTKRKLFMYDEPVIDDYGNLHSTGKKSRADSTLLHQFRSRRGLTEWCDKPIEFSLCFKESKNNETKPAEECCSQNQTDLDPFFRDQSLYRLTCSA